MKNDFNIILSFSKNRKLLFKMLSLWNAMLLIMISWKFLVFFFIENDQEWYMSIHIPLFVYVLNLLVVMKCFNVIFAVTEVEGQNINISDVWKRKKAISIPEIKFIKVPHGLWALNKNKNIKIYFDDKLNGFKELQSFLGNEGLLNHSEPLPMPFGYKESVFIAVLQLLFNSWLVFRIFSEYL